MKLDLTVVCLLAMLVAVFLGAVFSTEIGFYVAAVISGVMSYVEHKKTTRKV